MLAATDLSENSHKEIDCRHASVLLSDVNYGGVLCSGIASFSQSFLRRLNCCGQVDWCHGGLISRRAGFDSPARHQSNKEEP